MDTQTYEALSQLVRNLGQDPDIVIHRAIRNVESLLSRSNSQASKTPTMIDAVMAAQELSRRGIKPRTPVSEETAIDVIASAMLSNRGL